MAILLKERLKEARQKTGLKQWEVAEKLDLHKQAITKYEIGDREPSYDILAKLAVLYKVSIGWLFGESGINGEQPAKSEGGYKVIKGPIGDIQKIKSKEVLVQTLHDYLELILEKPVDDERRDRIIRDIWNLGEELVTVSEKESVIKRVLKKILTD